MLTAIGVSVTILLWVLLVAGIVRYWRDSKKAQALEDEHKAIENEHKRREQAADKQRDFDVSRAQEFYKEENVQLRREIEALKADLSVPSGELPYKAQRKVAEALTREVDEMTSAELREKIENDPAFLDRYNNLPWDTKAGCPTLLKQPSLQEKARALGNDLFAFLREKGPEPNPHFDASLSLEDRLREIQKVTGPYIEQVYYGYEHRFRQRVIDFFDEVGENGISVPGLLESDIRPPQGQNTERIKKIAETLFVLAARIDAAEAAEGA
jgi:hypothetical protein